MIRILLVVSGSGGDQVAFRYPTPNPKRRTDLLIYNRRPVAGLIDRDTSKKDGLPANARNKTASGAQQWLDHPVSGIPPGELANLFAPKSGLCGRVLDVVIDTKRLISFPVLVHGSHDLTLFNVVCIYKAETEHLEMYKDLSQKLAKVLEHEERRCGFVSTEVQTMFAVRDRFLAALNQQGAEVPKTPLNKAKAVRAMEEAIIKHSTLAHHLKTIAEEVSSQGRCILRVNGWANLDFSLPDPQFRGAVEIRPYQTLLLTARAQNIIAQMPVDSSPVMGEFLSLLNPCRSLWSLASHPQAGGGFFGQISTSTVMGSGRLALGHLQALSYHLVYYGKARVIDAISPHYVYVVSQHMKQPVGMGSKLAKDFANRFPQQNLPEVLSRFSVGKRLADHFRRLSKQAKAEVLKILIWLMQRQLVTQLRTYLYYMPERDRGLLEHLHHTSHDEQKDDDQDHDLSTTMTDAPDQKRRLPDVEEKEEDGDGAQKDEEEGEGWQDGSHNHLKSGGGGKGEEDDDDVELPSFEGAFSSHEVPDHPAHLLLKRVLPFLDGCHSYEEVCSLAQVAPTDLDRLVDAYPERIIKCMHD